MSNAVICDECGKVRKESNTLFCSDARVSSGEIVYGAHICDDCRGRFDTDYDMYGWHAMLKEEGGGEK